MTSVLASQQLPPGLIPSNQEPLERLPSLDDESHEANTHLHVSSHTVPRGPVTATLNFYDPPTDGAAPFNYVEEPPEGQPQRNFGASDHSINVQDIRGREQDFNVATHAFGILQGYPHNSAIDWDDDDSVKQHYYPEVERILLDNLPGKPNRVLIFDHTIRRADPEAHRAPVQRAHIDQTGKSTIQRVEFHLPDEADKLLQDRYRIVNVWRPLNGAVESYPLSFADTTTVPDDDMVPVEHRYPNRTGQTAAVKYNPDHAWYYWSGIDNDERILLQCYDSASPGTRVPHTAFVDPRQTDGSKPRESIEVRALVFG